ncbi:hypothetical protein [Paraburkholderia sp.]|uniref:hypothetical protein n=1 Tax=Paraburkholderia sp. TaxID=1926495 RepID=UPI0025FF175E|nr:hypothetical protein [Paraburkholderia sp.]
MKRQKMSNQAFWRFCPVTVPGVQWHVKRFFRAVGLISCFFRSKHASFYAL